MLAKPTIQVLKQFFSCRPRINITKHTNHGPMSLFLVDLLIILGQPWLEGHGGNEASFLSRPFSGPSCLVPNLPGPEESGMVGWVPYLPGRGRGRNWDPTYLAEGKEVSLLPTYHLKKYICNRIFFIFRAYLTSMHTTMFVPPEAGVTILWKVIT